MTPESQSAIMEINVSCVKVIRGHGEDHRPLDHAGSDLTERLEQSMEASMTKEVRSGRRGSYKSGVGRLINRERRGKGNENE